MSDQVCAVTDGAPSILIGTPSSNKSMREMLSVENAETTMLNVWFTLSCVLSVGEAICTTGGAAENRCEVGAVAAPGLGAGVGKATGTGVFVGIGVSVGGTGVALGAT